MFYTFMLTGKMLTPVNYDKLCTYHMEQPLKISTKIYTQKHCR